MNVGRLVFSVTCAMGLATMAGMPAHAAEARPWLCRSKPVFSSDSAMSYRVVNHGGSRWELLLMQFEPGSAHDGYEVVGTGYSGKLSMGVGGINSCVISRTWDPEYVERHVAKEAHAAADR